MNKVVWIGGPHGVGKSSIARVVELDNPFIKYLDLGKLFFENAEKIGYKWEDLSREENLLLIEGIVTDLLKDKILESNYLVDGHYAIHFGEITYPGYHSQNLRNLLNGREIKKGLIRLTADPEIILQRRNGSGKKFKAYPTEEDKEIIKKEIKESEDYFQYFYNALKPDVSVLELDTSALTIQGGANKIGEFYNEL